MHSEYSFILPEPDMHFFLCVSTFFIALLYAFSFWVKLPDSSQWLINQRALLSRCIVLNLFCGPGNLPFCSFVCLQRNKLVSFQHKVEWNIRAFNSFVVGGVWIWNEWIMFQLENTTCTFRNNLLGALLGNTHLWKT